jgi:hypothetical protein
MLAALFKFLLALDLMHHCMSSAGKRNGESFSHGVGPCPTHPTYTRPHLVYLGSVDESVPTSWMRPAHHGSILRATPVACAELHVISEHVQADRQSRRHEAITAPVHSSIPDND